MTHAPSQSVPPGEARGTRRPAGSPVAGGGVLAYSMSSGDSGGQEWDDKDPILNLSGGSYNTVQKTDENGQPIEGQYEVTDDVPIGSVVSVHAESPAQGYSFTDSNITWSGGTNISGYFSAGPTAVPIGGQTVQHNVLHQQDYIFVVDATARQYTATISIQRSNGASGSSTISFDSVRPDATLTVKPPLGTQTVKGDIYPNEVTVVLLPGIHIQATASTVADTAGSFMFMQLIISNYKTYVDDDGQSWYRKNDISYPGGDDFMGALYDDPPFGYEFTYDGPTDHHGWYLPANSAIPMPADPPEDTPAPPEMIDTPAMSVPDTYQGRGFGELFDLPHVQARRAWGSGSPSKPSTGPGRHRHPGSQAARGPRPPTPPARPDTSDARRRGGVPNLGESRDAIH